VKTSLAPHSPIVRLSSVSSCPTVTFYRNPPRKYESLQPSFERIKQYTSCTLHRTGRPQWRKMAVDAPPTGSFAASTSASKLRPSSPTPVPHRTLLAGVNNWSPFPYQFPTSAGNSLLLHSSRVGCASVLFCPCAPARHWT
jgi:hypothetical protein